MGGDFLLTQALDPSLAIEEDGVVARDLGLCFQCKVPLVSRGKMSEVCYNQRLNVFLRLDHRVDHIFVFVDEVKGLGVIGSRVDENGAVHAILNLTPEMRVIPVASVLRCLPLVAEALAGENRSLSDPRDAI